MIIILVVICLGITTNNECDGYESRKCYNMVKYLIFGDVLREERRIAGEEMSADERTVLGMFLQWRWRK